MVSNNPNNFAVLHVERYAVKRPDYILVPLFARFFQLVNCLYFEMSAFRQDTIASVRVSSLLGARCDTPY